MASIFWISWLVRKPSKKCRNGTLPSMAADAPPGPYPGLLDRVGCQQRKTGLAHGHDVLVVAKNRQGVGGNGAGGYMKHAGQHSPLILYMFGIISNRPWEAVKVLVSAPAGQGAVHGGGGPGFGLKLADQHADRKYSRARGGPFIGDLADGRGGCDRINRRRRRSWHRPHGPLPYSRRRFHCLCHIDIPLPWPIRC
jgi:hypothetical protein